jgi:hypothetical protein
MACMSVLQEQKPVIAMDGVYAGFAGAKTGHRNMTLRGCFLILIRWQERIESFDSAAIAGHARDRSLSLWSS